jgi:aspartate beta-hydroxylase
LGYSPAVITGDLRSAAEAGLQALQRGDPASARPLLETALKQNPAEARLWVALAHACGAVRDPAAKLRALDRALALRPRHVQALVMKADFLAERGEAGPAATLYQLAIDAVPDPQSAPPEVQRLLAHARGMCERVDARYEAQLMDALRARGFDVQRASPRFRESLDIAFGRRQPFIQQPTRYFFPGLPQVQFYEREALPWLGEIEARTDEIRGELLEVMKEEAAFKPYVERTSAEQGMHSLVDNPEWSAFYLWKNGVRVDENAARCPKTVAAMEHAPLDRVVGATPSVLFSRLRPHAHIPPHCGMLNTRLICHLPLILPSGCRLRVGNETRAWKMGEALAFDDSIEHEAWNDSGETRVVLIFDVWRPELTAEERELVTAMLEIAFRRSAPHD